MMRKHDPRGRFGQCIDIIWHFGGPNLCHRLGVAQQETAADSGQRKGLGQCACHKQIFMTRQHIGHGRIIKFSVCFIDDHRDLAECFHDAA